MQSFYLLLRTLAAGVAAVVLLLGTESSSLGENQARTTLTGAAITQAGMPVPPVNGTALLLGACGFLIILRRRALR
jgi:hypothetical protein